MRFARRKQVWSSRKIILPSVLTSSLILCLLFEIWLEGRDVISMDRPGQRARFMHYGVRLPDSLNFCGELFPRNDSVIVKRLERELLSKSFHIPQYKLFISRCRTWFPVIEPILKKNGVPDDFKYVALIESNLSNAVSPKGAAGFWQFIPESGRMAGLEVNEFVDERFDVEKSTEAACRYIRNCYKTFNNWTLAAAAYNLGEGGIAQQIKRQPGKSFYEMKFNRETAIYMYKLIAMKEVISRPKYYGILKIPKGTRVTFKYKVKKVDVPIEDLAAWAQSQGTTLLVLQHLNPWLRGNQLPNHEGKTYRIHVPDGEYSEETLKELLTPENTDSLLSPPSEDSLKLSNFALRDSTGKGE